MITAKIARQAYRRTPQSSLAAFTDNVIKRMTGVAAYEAIQPPVLQLSTLLQRYEDALSAARNRGRSEIIAKNLAQTALFQQLDAVAIALDRLAQGDVQLIVDAGFTVQQSTSVRYSDKLEAPMIMRVTSTGKRGEVRVEVDDRVPYGVVLTHEVEYSQNRDSGWQRANFHSHRKFVMDGLPRTDELWLRLKSIGHGKNMSDWSDPVVVAVF